MNLWREQKTICNILFGNWLWQVTKVVAMKAHLFFRAVNLIEIESPHRERMVLTQHNYPNVIL